MCELLLPVVVLSFLRLREIRVTIKLRNIIPWALSLSDLEESISSHPLSPETSGVQATEILGIEEQQLKVQKGFTRRP